MAATRNTGAPVFVASRSLVAGTVGFALHRGVVAVATRPPLPRAEQLEPTPPDAQPGTELLG